MDDLCVSARGAVDNALKSSSFFEKLDVDGTIRKASQALGSHDRVLVLSCGPKSLMEAVQDSVTKWQKKRNIRIDVHCEDFGG